VILSSVLRALLLRPLPEQSRFAPGRFRRCACALMIVVMFSNSAMASPQIAHAMANTARTSALGQLQAMNLWLNRSGWAARVSPMMNSLAALFQLPQKLPKGWDGIGAPPNTPPAPARQETKEEREMKVWKVRIFPGDVEVRTAEQVVFTAAGYDKDDNQIGGLNVQWEGLDETKKTPLTFSSTATFAAGEPGTYKITARVAGKQASARVTVTGESRRENIKSADAVPSSSGNNPTEEPKQKSLLTPKRWAPKSKDRSLIAEALTTRKSKNAGLNRPGLHAAASGMTAAPVMQSGGSYGDYWNGTNCYSADDPDKQRGDAPGQEVSGAGSGNFQFAAPVIGLDGRGLDLALALHYNSRVWHKAGTEMYFDIDQDWPAPGWSLGFGKIVMAGADFILIEGDGTRHSFDGVRRGSFPSPYSSLQTFEGYTTDGSFIDYYAEAYKPEFTSQYNRNLVTAWAMLPNGTRIDYGAPANYAIYPVKITDANGNFLTITYRTRQLSNGQWVQCGPNIETITDTLGRQIRFYYEAQGNGEELLTTITAPGYNYGPERDLVRLQYQTLNLNDAGSNYGFAGVTTHVRQQYGLVNVLRAIIYPATNTGYWFGDADSYSRYGMLRKISEQRGMSNTVSTRTQQAAISIQPNNSGMSHQMAWSHNTQAGYSALYGPLYDVPEYKYLTEDWAGRVTTTAPVTEFTVSNQSGYGSYGNVRITTVTQPDGAVTKQIADNNVNTPNYGLLLEDITYPDSASATNDLNRLSRSKVTWEQSSDSYSSPRPTLTESWDERNQYIYSTFVYGSYNQVTISRNYGYGGEPLNRTDSGYNNSSGYTGSLAGSGTLWWHTNGVYGGPDWSGPHIFNLTTYTEVFSDEGYTRVARTDYEYDNGSLTIRADAMQHTYKPAQRGLVTKVTRYANAASLDLSTAVTETRTYDDCGNMITAATACCQTQTYTYTSGYGYAWPTSSTSGAAPGSGPYNSVSAVYDFNTGLTLNSTDANGRISQNTYDAITLRPVFEYTPTNSYLWHYYDDTGLMVADIVYDAVSNGYNWASRTDKYLDGMGRIHGEVAWSSQINDPTAVLYDIVDTKYDNMGRLWQQTRPYRYGATDLPWYTYGYDKLGRTTSITAPDGSVTQRFYNESTYPSGATQGVPGQTLRVSDPWSRERWARFDSQNRLVEVVEPNPDGNGLLTAQGTTGQYRTTYSYDTLGRLTGTSQGAQTRSFRYDALGRMTHQKLAEREAKLTDSGQHVTSGGTWSDWFRYDTRNNLVEQKNARGVQTLFNYNNDPLNRLQSVQYSAPAGITPAPNVSYSYVTSGDLTRLNNVTVDGGWGNESFGYDSEGRLSWRQQTLPGREGNPIRFDYTYDTLDRMWKLTYPAQHNAGGVRREQTVTFDTASRLKTLQFGGTTMAQNIEYNAASQTLTMSVGGQASETYEYEAKLGLLTRQQVFSAGQKRVDLSYNYTLTLDPNNAGAKTGQLTGITDNQHNEVSPGTLNGKNRQYTYDQLCPT
jgi:YD repeat-containing protein